MLSMACSKWMRALLTAVEIGASISGGASRRSSSSSGIVVAGGALSLESHIGPSVLLGSPNRVRMWDERGRSSGSGGSGSCSLSRLNFFGPRGSKAESSQEELWSERDLVGPIAAVTGVDNPLGTGPDRCVHVNQEARVRAAAKLGGANRTARVGGQHFKEGRFAVWGLPFGADSFTCEDTEHAGLEKVNTERISVFKCEPAVFRGGSGGPNR